MNNSWNVCFFKITGVAVAFVASMAGVARAEHPTPATTPPRHTRSAQSDFRSFLPQVQHAEPANKPPPPTPVPGGRLPAELVSTWFSGQLLNISLYDPVRKVWDDAGGLGHTYAFDADGGYVLASFLHIKSGPFCESRVWKYEKGSARSDGAKLLVTPSAAQTRTKIDCGGSSDTDTLGSFATYQIPWQLGDDGKGHSELTLTEAHGPTKYFKDALGPHVLGAWQTGDVRSSAFYDPESNMWAQPTGLGEWFRFNANGTFDNGKIELRYVDGACDDAVMTYRGGALTGSGSTIVLKTQKTLRRVVNLCSKSQVSDETLSQVDDERWTWSVTQEPAGQTLNLIKVSAGFQQRILLKEPAY